MSIKIYKWYNIRRTFKKNCQLNNLYNIEETKFYITILLMTIDYLHNKMIAHRDIKPNNIMIDLNGYLKLIDFRNTKVCKNYISNVIGTPHYIDLRFKKEKVILCLLIIGLLK